MRFRFLIAYDGAPFRGWQSQKGGEGIQDIIESALLSITGKPCRLHASGRTDAGVHALGQCAHADIHTRLQTADLQRALNANLPPQIRILSVRRVPDSFHARFSAIGKIYRYRIWNTPVLPPLEYGRAWHIPRPLDLVAMRSAASLLEGRHDFASFSANRGKPTEDTVRTLHRIGIRRQGGLITLTFEAEGFLYKMARMLTGALCRVGLGKESEKDIAAHLDHPRVGAAVHVAPAEGLTLIRVRYPASGRAA